MDRFRTRQEIGIDHLISLETLQREMREMLQSMPEGIDPKTYLADSISLFTKTLLRDRREEITDLANGLLENHTGSPKDMAEDLAHLIYGFIRTNYDARGLEKNIRNHITTREDSINELLHFSVHNNELYLHVAPAQTLPIQEKLKLLREGLNLLAQRLKNDTNLEHVNRIGAVSWIVAENPRLLEKLGFAYEGNLNEERMIKSFPGENRAVGEAYISRKDFLTKYLK